MSWFRSDSKLPPGDTGRILVGNTFSFHDSAQALVLNAAGKYPGSPVIRLKVINRNVALVLDYRVAQDVVESSSGSQFGHRDAYTQLLAPFYPDPNILLEDSWEDGHSAHRSSWEQHFASVDSSLLDGILSSIIPLHSERWLSPVDLYKSCKDLSQAIVMRLFLGLDENDAIFSMTVKKTSEALHGQFSAPLRLGLAGYESTYSRGLQAQADFDIQCQTRIKAGVCPFLLQPTAVRSESVTSHMSVFTSSLVVKALASYMTFAFLQHSRSPHADLDQLLLESERLAPPITGLLRRVHNQSWMPSSEVNVPVGWDVWLYFPLINRSEAVYGADARLFRPERWTGNLPESMTFGGGSRKCLGIHLVRQIVKAVLKGVLGGMTLSVGDVEPSVQDFLGWELGEEARNWAGIKQLPVQRPKRKITAQLNPKG